MAGADLGAGAVFAGTLAGALAGVGVVMVGDALLGGRRRVKAAQPGAVDQPFSLFFWCGCAVGCLFGVVLGAASYVLA